MSTPIAKLVCVDPLADLPILWERLRQLNFVELCDKHFPKPLHWKGELSVGQVLAVTLLYVTSQADHRLVRVEDWAALHQPFFSSVLGVAFRPKDLHDDRLADLLGRLGRGDSFAGLEADLNRNAVRVYDLPCDTVRLDTTTANVDRDSLDDDGLIQFGHSKDDSSRPQFKIAAAVVDPLGMPLCTVCWPGNTADDCTYIPSIRAVMASLPAGNRLFVGDCKMAALEIRTFVVDQVQRYLCPLSEKQLSQAERLKLLQPVFRGEQALEQVFRPGQRADDPPELVAEGFVLEVKLPGADGELSSGWTERRFVVRSRAYAQAGERALERRLQKTREALLELPTRRKRKKVLTYQQMQQESQRLIADSGLAGLLSCRVNRVEHRRVVRGYGGQEAREEVEEELSVEVTRDEEAIERHKQQLGWQVYASNDGVMSLSEVVWGYRGQYRVEDAFSRLKGQTLCLTPIYLQDEERIQGLVHLLSVALRVLTLLEWQLGKALAEGEKELRGLYAGQPGRKTSSPSAELLLRAFSTVSVTVVEVAGVVQALLTPLTTLQRRVLQLLGLPPDLYDIIALRIALLYQNTSEP